MMFGWRPSLPTMLVGISLAAFTRTPFYKTGPLLRHVPGWLDPLVVGVPDARLPRPGRQAPWKDGALAATHNAVLDDGALLEVCHGIDGECAPAAVGGGEVSPID